MVRALWQTERDRVNLLKKLVKHDSVTYSEGERQFPDLVKTELLKTDYFKSNEENIYFAYTTDDRRAVLAHYESNNTKDTVVLISHFDTVGIEDFGDYKNDAFNIDKITEIFKSDRTYLNEDAVKDIETDNYYFGRGSMDMKPGLMLHMTLIEKAAIENWNINLILITVPDEEVGSKGMRAAVKKLNDIRKEKDLNIVLHLNSEPTFQQAPGSNTHYIYSGTIGKLMPSVYVYGKETHVGNAMNGISSNWLMSFINRKIEYNHSFIETYKNESTPLPVSLMMRDLKEQYDVQTPFRTVSLYNLFIFKKSAEDIFNTFNELVKVSVKEAEEVICKFDDGIYKDDKITINTLKYEELIEQAIDTHGRDKVNELLNSVEKNQDDHLQCIEAVDKIMMSMRHIAPAVVTFFTPPYYPATNSSEDKIVTDIIETIKDTSATLNRDVERIHFFNGICDLSYVKYDTSYESDQVFSHNTPTFNTTYMIPFDDIKEISAPVLNCGPIGKDAHKVTERILKPSAFKELPVVLESIIKTHFVK